MMPLPKISFVTVNYNSGAKVCALIESLRENASDFEVVVVDNASVDNSRELLSNIEGADLSCIFNSENLGYGRANNIGVAKAKSDIVVLINPDALLEPASDVNDYFIRNLGSAEIGVVAPRIVYPDGLPQPNFSQRYSSIQTYVPQLLSLGKIFRYLKARGVGVGLAEKLGALVFGSAGREYANRFKVAEYSQNCEWASGACIGIRKEVFLRVGGFDDRFFLYSEDEDLCRRIRLGGMLIRYDPSLSIVHEEGGTHASNKKLGHLGWGDLHRINSGLIYLSKYRSGAWIGIKLLYISSVFIRLLLGLYFIISPLQSLRLIKRLIKV